jgi:hypothetical protein
MEAFRTFRAQLANPEVNSKEFEDSESQNDGMLAAIVCFDAFRCNKRVHDQRGQWWLRIKGDALLSSWKGTKPNAS